MTNIIQQIEEETLSYFTENDLKSMVIGVSGGIDSALVCALMRPICDDLGIPLIGRSLPIQTNKPDEILRAAKVGKAFCTDFSTVDLGATFENLYDGVEDPELTPLDEVTHNAVLGSLIRRGNIKARLRMIYLYNLASKTKGLVLSTDNYTEFLLGFWTLNGDVGDFSPIQELWKTEVYEMSRYLCNGSRYTKAQKEALDLCVKAVPTDGLGITNSDLDQIGASTYGEVDLILKKILKGDSSQVEHPIFKRYLNSEFKRFNPHIVKLRKHIDTE